MPADQAAGAGAGVGVVGPRLDTGDDGRDVARHRLQVALPAGGEVRVHERAPSFANVQALPLMAEGGLVADLIAVIASTDPVMGEVDR